MESFLDTQPWYHGKITRVEAENLLQNKAEGTYLLRDSTTSDYAISVVHEGSVVHYLVQRTHDGKYGIESGPRFSSPIHLVAHHQHNLDGLLTKLTIPCNRSTPRPQSTYGLDRETEKMIKDITQNLGLTNNPILEDDLRGTISKSLHTNKPWYHGPISRIEAERRLRESGSEDGLFLVRDSQDPSGSFAIGLCYSRMIYHYHLKMDARKRLCIEGGPKFSSCFEAVTHYTQQADGLLWPLVTACPARSQTLPRPPAPSPTIHTPEPRERTFTLPDQYNDHSRDRSPTGPFTDLNFVPPPSPGRQLPRISPLMQPVLPQTTFAMRQPVATPTDVMVQQPGALPIKPMFQQPNPPPTINYVPKPGIPPPKPKPPPMSTALQRPSFPPPVMPPRPNPPPPPRFEDAVPPGSHNDSVQSPASDSQNRVAFEKIYDTVSMKKCLGYTNCFKGIKEVKFSSLTLDEKVIGTGNFGSVLKGVYNLPRGEQIPVAVKSLKTADISEHQRTEIITEARIMTALDHSNIVRMVGLCQNSSGAILIVMELAEEGPLHKYLKKNNTLPLVNILIMMLQVTEGMAYLAEKKLIHRDLAARNVLVVNKDFVKISDFGLSKAMGVGEEYYKAQNYGKWPLKWYAPECILFRKFSPESDVWSYGVTLYEAVTYGAKPYQGMDGRTIIGKLEEGYRLPCPPFCPKPVYDIMYSCWEWKADKRPTFNQLGTKLAKYITQLKSGK